MTVPAHADLPLLDGMRIVVTGAASGIGLAGTGLFAARGARVFLTDCDAAGLDAVLAASRGAGVLAGDVTSAADCEAVVAAARAAMGGIDGLFHAAGVGDLVMPALELPVEEWQRIVDINLRGTFLMATAAGRPMLEQGHGAIVTVASVLALGGIPRRLAYGPAKAAVAMLTRNLACEWAARGVRVNALAPGYIRTPLTDALIADGKFDEGRIAARTPMGRMGEADEVCDAAAFLLSAMARYVTGAVLPVDGGWSAYSGAGDVATA